MLDGVMLGALDLLSGEIVRFGETVIREGIPDECQAQYIDARQALLETLAEVDDTILATYLAGEVPPEAQLREAVRRATLSLHGFPVLCGSALKYQGIEPLLDAVVDYLPSPADPGPVMVTFPDGQTAALTGDFPVALAFKTVAETFGTLTFVRVYSGQLQTGMTLRTASTGERGRAATRVFTLTRPETSPLSALVRSVLFTA